MKICLEALFMSGRSYKILLQMQVKYNKPNGKVILECRELPPKNEKAVFEFVCTDNGIGMSPEFQEHAFEPFVQENSSARTSYTGTGLGTCNRKETGRTDGRNDPLRE